VVENAIKHGVAKVEGTGHIALRARIDGSQLVLCVENNAPLGEVGTGSISGTGVGVRNTRARLSHLYGDEQSFDLRAGEGPVTIAEIRLPYHTRADLRTSAVVSIA
jgi:LytS/YehU family sensor histidine kinase